MLQYKLQMTIDAQNTGSMGGTSLVFDSEDTTLAGTGVVDNSKKYSLDDNIKGNSPFMKILEKPLGYTKTDEQQSVYYILQIFATTPSNSYNSGGSSVVCDLQSPIPWQCTSLRGVDCLHITLQDFSFAPKLQMLTNAM